MERKKQLGSSSSSSSSSSYSSSSSFASELFGSKDSLSPSAGIFGSIFAPSAKVFGRESLRSEVVGKKLDSANEPYNTKTGVSGDTSKTGGSEIQSAQNSDASAYYQEQRVLQPCHLSSSIYYGGPDICANPESTQGSTYKKDGGEDDSGSASRGNWWKGSLYY
ncbi:nuclear pore complex protein DDB_G0274915 [Carica papaya]|uniref:nuclear pore complex protein DDB_G0274915 n=1 Tax=Carica papaya TaxID=3649 RepID=UPI000B8CFD81|nr:nuclear pore complex protein DDB_G0274915 [Carica papaya]